MTSIQRQPGPWTLWFLLAGLLLAWCRAGWAGAAIGEVFMARGAAVAQQDGAPPRVLGAGSPLLAGDTLETEAASFLVAELADGTRITLRPASELHIAVFDTTPGAEQALFDLRRGGLQAQSGRIARLGRDNFRLRTPRGTLQIQGARFNARLCEGAGDCRAEVPADLGRQLAPAGDPVAARVVRLRGEARARGRDDPEPHPLLDGSPLFPGDTLTTGEAGHLVLAFRDGGRITLVENTRFVIQAYRYEGDREGVPEGRGQAILRLLKGGLRALSGFIGKESEEDYQVETPITTIGVRGTGWDSLCRGDCLEEGPVTSPRRPDGSYRDGLYDHTWAGTIVQHLEVGDYPLARGRAAYLPNPRTPPIALDELPPFLADPGAPRPDRVAVNLPHLFGTTPLPGTPAGLYLYLEQGDVRLDGLALGRGEAGYAGSAGPLRLPAPRGFQLRDPYPAPWRNDIAEDPRYSLLSDDTTLITDFACKVR